jgi:hypothetical protein
MASSAGKYMFDESPEKSPATPMRSMTTHFCRVEKTWYCSSALLVEQGVEGGVGNVLATEAVSVWCCSCIANAVSGFRVKDALICWKRNIKMVKERTMVL